ncbi:winged helix-turn-helix transcriptional regulator [Asaia sp. As-1742]|uniref:winged helix-turn-helix transcriptional regulator n=1 Tax=Asaia sp. As-1742 TaxID=2608325 RepID=UPI001423CBBC|nr:helix-turn-helix transcriptional regulator [Asaia sp. As-1742]
MSRNYYGSPTRPERTFSARSIQQDTVLPHICHRTLDFSLRCALKAGLQLIDGKWKGVILFRLLQRMLRFDAIRERLLNIPQKMPTLQLREFERPDLCWGGSGRRCRSRLNIS